MPFRLLIVDDSPLFRLRLSQVFAASDSLQIVGLATNGRDAIRLLKERRAEAILLDLEMPELDGFSVLRWVMSHQPMPVVVCSAQSDHESVFRALEAGAVDFITKPELRHAIRSEEFAANLRRRVEAAVRSERAKAQLTKPESADDESSLESEQISQLAARRKGTEARAVAIVGSAGAPAAVTRIVAELPADFAHPVIIALHMPPGFTRSFADRLNRMRPASFSVQEARDGDAIENAQAQFFVAPGGHHTTFLRKRDGEVQLRVEAATGDFNAPSANRLLKSLAEVYGSEALGIVLTGMGEDGLEGARAVSERGGAIIVESRQSATIWGMPRAIAEAGLADAETTLSEIARALPLLVNSK